MNIELFVLFIVISVALVFLGFTQDIRALSTVGFFFIFLLSIILINNDLQYQSGVTITTSNSTLTSVNYNYSPFSDNTRTYGIYLAFASVGGMVLSLTYGKSIGVKK